MYFLLNQIDLFCCLQGDPGSSGAPGEAGRNGGDVCLAHIRVFNFK